MALQGRGADRYARRCVHAPPRGALAVSGGKPDTMTDGPVLLASRSPRRQALLEQIGVPYAVVPADIDEARLAGEAPARYVERLARAKAEVVYARDGTGCPVLAADTTVALGERIYGKPDGAADGARMLLELAGRTHQVLTCVALAHAGGLESVLSVSEVSFGPIDAGACARYWATGEPADKAGGYAVQGLGALFIRHLSGSYSGVMGLPLRETAQLLDGAGIRHALGPVPA